MRTPTLPFPALLWSHRQSINQHRGESHRGDCHHQACPPRGALGDPTPQTHVPICSSGRARPGGSWSGSSDGGTARRDTGRAGGKPRPGLGCQSTISYLRSFYLGLVKERFWSNGLFDLGGHLAAPKERSMLKNFVPDPRKPPAPFSPLSEDWQSCMNPKPCACF